MKQHRNKYGYLVDDTRPAKSMGEVGVEVYNPHPEAIIFELCVKDLLTGLEISPGERRKICKSEDYCYLPYGVQYYSTRWDRSGSSAEGITVCLIFGRDIGTGYLPPKEVIADVKRGQRRIF